MKEKEEDMISLERWVLFMNISNYIYPKYSCVNPCIKLYKQNYAEIII